jgi:integrase
VTFTEQEVKTFAEFASPYLARLFEVCVDLGTRPMEAGRVTTGDVKRTKAGFCWVLEPHECKNGRKSGKRRVIPLTPKWEAYTKKKLAEAERNGEPVLLFRCLTP